MGPLTLPWFVLNAMQRHHDARGGDAVLFHCCLLFKSENGQRGGCTALLPAVLSLLVSPTKNGQTESSEPCWLLSVDLGWWSIDKTGAEVAVSDTTSRQTLFKHTTNKNQEMFMTSNNPHDLAVLTCLSHFTWTIWLHPPPWRKRTPSQNLPASFASKEANKGCLIMYGGWISAPSRLCRGFSHRPWSGDRFFE